LKDITLTADYIYTRQTKLDLENIKSSAHIIHALAKDKFYDPAGRLDPNVQLDYKIWAKYNLLMYPLPGFHDLYNEIKSMFDLCNTDKNNKYYIQSWVNFYYHNDFIEWHYHSPKEHNAWHGFLCVDCEPSYTAYKILNYPEIIRIPSENGTIVLSRSGEDQHRTAPWPDTTRPRITIAFDIIPQEFIRYDEFLNHWIPI